MTTLYTRVWTPLCHASSAIFADHSASPNVILGLAIAQGRPVAVLLPWRFRGGLPRPLVLSDRLPAVLAR